MGMRRSLYLVLIGGTQRRKLLLGSSQPLLQLQLLQLLDQQIDLHVVCIGVQGLQLALSRWIARCGQSTPRSDLHGRALNLVCILRAHRFGAVQLLVHVSGRGLELGIQFDLIIDSPPLLLLLYHLLVLIELKTFIFLIDVRYY